MWIYTGLNLLIIIVGMCTYSRKRYPKYSMIFLVGALILVAGLRGNFTQDYDNYATYFLYLDNISFREILHKEFFSMERGFLFLGKIVRSFTDEVWIYFLVVSAITVIAYYVIFKKYSSIVYLTILLFVSVGDYYASFNLCRQVMAAAISFYAIRYLLDDESISKYILCILCATLIHRSSIIMLAMYYLLKREISLKNILGIGIITVGLYSFMPYIIRIVQYVFPIYQDYSYGMKTGTFNAVIPTLGMTVISLICIKYLRCDFNLVDIKNRVWINGSIWACVFLILGIRVYMVTRMAYFFKPFSWILVSNVIYSCKKSRERILMIVIVAILANIFVWVTLRHTAYNPYRFYWE